MTRGPFRGRNVKRSRSPGPLNAVTENQPFPSEREGPACMSPSTCIGRGGILWRPHDSLLSKRRHCTGVEF